MANYIVNGDDLTAIANAIREKTASIAKMRISDMPAQIAGITGGSTEDIDAIVQEQADLIAQAIELLEEKATYNTIYIGTSEPTTDIGVAGDIYIVRSEA